MNMLRMDGDSHTQTVFDSVSEHSCILLAMALEICIGGSVLGMIFEYEACKTALECCLLLSSSLSHRNISTRPRVEALFDVRVFHDSRNECFRQPIFVPAVMGAIEHVNKL